MNKIFIAFFHISIVMGVGVSIMFSCLKVKSFVFNNELHAAPQQ